MNPSRPSNDIILAFIGLIVLSGIVFSWIYFNNESKEFLRQENQLRDAVSAGPIISSTLTAGPCPASAARSAAT